MTAQRRVLIEVIQETDGHLDAAALLERAEERDAQIDRATVYRTLELLKTLRLIDELNLVHLNGEPFYEAKTTVDHVHLACFQYGRIDEFPSPLFERLKDKLSRKNGFRIRVTRLEAGGQCSVCSARNGKTDALKAGVVAVLNQA